MISSFGSAALALLQTYRALFFWGSGDPGSGVGQAGLAVCLGEGRRPQGCNRFTCGFSSRFAWTARLAGVARSALYGRVLEQRLDSSAWCVRRVCGRDRRDAGFCGKVVESRSRDRCGRGSALPTAFGYLVQLAAPFHTFLDTEVSSPSRLCCRLQVLMGFEPKAAAIFQLSD